MGQAGVFLLGGRGALGSLGAASFAPGPRWSSRFLKWVDTGLPHPNGGHLGCSHTSEDRPPGAPGASHVKM